MTDRLSAAFAALADPTRRAILARLALGETTVSELARPFAMSGPAVSRHLKVLETAGLISRGREAQWRPCRIEPAALKQVDDWLERYRQFWEQSFDRLEAYLHELQADGAASADAAALKAARQRTGGQQKSHPAAAQARGKAGKLKKVKTTTDTRTMSKRRRPS
jgi:DNA-binding transcriptional ArsR family regulator